MAVRAGIAAENKENISRRLSDRKYMETSKKQKLPQQQ